MLSQFQDGEEPVIAYVSKSLEGSEQRYCTARKELLAVVQALKHFKCYIYGQKITVRTDNSAVSPLHRSKDPVGQPARWIEVIDTYDITFQHRPGQKHGNANALSRYPCRQCGGDCEGTPAKGVRAVTRSQRCESCWTPEEMAEGQEADPDIGPIMQWRHQSVVPEDRRRIIRQRLHRGAIGAHLGTASTLALAEQGFYWAGMRADVSKICTECDCTMLKRRRGRR